MSGLPSNFNPATYLFLNPELQAFSNVTTIEDAITYYQTQPNGNSLLYDMSSIDPLFNSYVFLSSSRDGLDISNINRSIRLALSNDGLSQLELNAQSKFIQTIAKPIRHSFNNLFSFEDALYRVNRSNLLVGEDVNVFEAGGHEIIGKVTAIDSNTVPNQFQLSNYANYAFTSNQSNLTLFGQRLYDVDRLAKINWLRGYRSSTPNVSYIVDESFNPDLYRLLYPPARAFDNVQALLDYNTYITDPFGRVGRVNDITRNVDDDFVTLANTKIEWASNSAAESVIKAVWSSNYTGSYLSTQDAQILYAPSNTTSEKLQWTSNSLSNVFRSDGSNITVHSISSLSNSIATTGNWSFTSNVNVNRILTVGQSMINQNGNVPTVIDARGGIRADDYILTSDVRTKENIVKLEAADCFEFVNQTNPVRFNFVKDGSFKENRKIGFIAQELESIQSCSLQGSNVVQSVHDCIPNIMKTVPIDRNGTITLENHGLVAGTEICVMNQTASKVTIQRVDDADHFTIDTLFLDYRLKRGNGDWVFLYGTYVDDFKVIDQSHLLAIAFGAIKELIHKVQSLESLFLCA